ncbi:MAG TPA: cytochrome c [Roseiarcus sp.]|nr:cytochrome c [Roseiarcus sp.]
MKRIALASLVSLTLAAPAGADPLTFQLPEETAQLKASPGADIATTRCSACHSVDYISTQPSNKGKAFWDAEVQKMIKVFKAQIGPSDAAAIADYLAANY